MAERVDFSPPEADELLLLPVMAVSSSYAVRWFSPGKVVDEDCGSLPRGQPRQRRLRARTGLSMTVYSHQQGKSGWQGLKARAGAGRFRGRKKRRNRRCGAGADSTFGGRKRLVATPDPLGAEIRRL